MIFSHLHGCYTHDLSGRGVLGSFVGLNAITLGMKLLEGAGPKESPCVSCVLLLSTLKYQDLSWVRLWMSQSWTTSDFCLEGN